MESHLPFNLDAEEGILACIVYRPSSLAEIADLLHPDDFYRDAHKTIYLTMLKLYQRHRMPDVITLTDALEQEGKLEDVGGFSYVASLFESIAVMGDSRSYAAIIKRCSLCRRYIAAASEIVGLAYAQDEGIVQKAEQLIYAVQRYQSDAAFASMMHVMLDYMQELDTLEHDKHLLTGVTTGYADLDDPLGGLQKSDLIILGGRPGSGKTALAVNIAYHAAAAGKRIAVFSLEMGNRQLARRLMAMESRIDTQRLRKGWWKSEDWDALVSASGTLSELPIWLNDTSGTPILSMRSQVRRLLADVGSIDLIIVDYLGLIESGEDERRRENRVQEISVIARGLKMLAKEFNLPVLALAQLSRKVEERANKRPQLSDLKESGTIEEAADVVLFMYRDDYYAEQEGRANYTPTHIAEVSIAKHRNGPVAELQLYFQKELTRFYPIREEKH